MIIERNPLKKTTVIESVVLNIDDTLKQKFDIIGKSVTEIYNLSMRTILHYHDADIRYNKKQFLNDILTHELPRSIIPEKKSILGKVDKNDIKHVPQDIKILYITKAFDDFFKMYETNPKCRAIIQNVNRMDNQIVDVFDRTFNPDSYMIIIPSKGIRVYEDHIHIPLFGDLECDNRDVKLRLRTPGHESKEGERGYRYIDPAIIKNGNTYEFSVMQDYVGCNQYGGTL